MAKGSPLAIAILGDVLFFSDVEPVMLHPWKSKIDIKKCPKNDDMENVSPFKHGYSSISILIFQWCILYTFQYYPECFKLRVG